MEHEALLEAPLRCAVMYRQIPPDSTSRTGVCRSSKEDQVITLFAMKVADLVRIPEGIYSMPCNEIVEGT